MTDALVSPAEAPAPLRFACACASGQDISNDPWAAISKDGKLKDGTKEQILNAIYRQPRTTAQLALHLGISRPAVHRHISELLASELIREVEVPDEKRMSVVERYYRPNFPVVFAQDRAVFQPILVELARAFAQAFRSRQEALAEAFTRTSLANHAEHAEVLLHYFYTEAARMARRELEVDGSLPPWADHRDGSRWLWWAEEPSADR
jgi:DNA-binding transcriptional ArsR family regulator